MAYLEGISLKSSETLRQWFKKLQCIIPGNYSRNEMKPTKNKLIHLNSKLIENKIGDDVFPSQKNLNVIMSSLRKDLVNLLRKSKSHNSITLIIYKLNILENNIREVCRFQHTWVNHPLSITENLRVQEKYIIRLIEEIMDDIFDAYSSIKRKVHHFSFNERNINSIISVLGILKREVCNMIHVIITCIEQRHKSTLYEKIFTPLNAIEHKKELSIKRSFETDSTNKKESKSSQAFLPNNKSYPFLERSSVPVFSSLQNIRSRLTGNTLGEDSDYFNGLVKEDISMGNYDLQELSTNKNYNNQNKTNGQGDADNIHNDQNEIEFTLMHNSEELRDEHKVPSKISKPASSYFSIAEKNKSSLLSYNKEHSNSKNIKEKNAKYGKNGNQKQEDSQTYLCKNISTHSWPSVTVVRDIKSETHLDSTLKYDRLGTKDYYKSYYSSDESSKDDISDSDSDDSYISCVVDEFQLDQNFLNHIKEKYLPDKPHKKTLEGCAERNDTKSFSCKSPKLSQIFTGRRIIRRKEEPMAREIYHSVESLQTETTQEQEQLSRESKSINVAISTDNELNLRALEYKHSWEGYKFNNMDDELDLRELGYKVNNMDPCQVQRTLIDSFNTLALSDDCAGYGAMYTESILSFASVAMETEDVTERDQDNMEECNESSKKHQVHHYCGIEGGSYLEDSQFSSMFLALPPSSIRLVNIANEGNLLAIEIE